MDFIFMMAPQGGEGGGGSLVTTLIMFGSIFLIFYFMIIRPQQKRAKERDKMISAAGKGDKIVTNGGVHGTIAGVDDDTVLLKVSDTTKITIDKSAIGKVVSSKSGGDESK
jgi:preprotein translocase subunit YajC